MSKGDCLPGLPLLLRETLLSNLIWLTSWPCQQAGKDQKNSSYLYWNYKLQRYTTISLIAISLSKPVPIMCYFCKVANAVPVCWYAVLECLECQEWFNTGDIIPGIIIVICIIYLNFLVVEETLLLLLCQVWYLILL